MSLHKSMDRKLSSIINYDRRRLVRTLRYTLFLVPGPAPFMAASKLGGEVSGLFEFTAAPQLPFISAIQEMRRAQV